MMERVLPVRRSSRFVWLLSALVAWGAVPAGVEAAEPVGLRVPEGFEVTLYADDDLAHDIHALTIDSLGRVVVSGPGYVRILIDSSGDGRADTMRQFADGPAAGAQGMHFYGRDLLCVGDAGLIRYRDDDGDDRADGPPDVFLKIKTGGEHHAHAVRKGPDGWWYLIAGNDAGVTKAYATLPTSPVRNPDAGVVLRLKPDLSGGEIVADGFRNAYDFDFHAQGDLFVFDSDGERDVSLPWYRPIRVFHTLPASNAGWITRSWKRPDEYADMPPVVAEFGRGSPTGVVCYRHRQFPEPYRDALFVLDWTFGRVVAVPLHRDGATWSSEPIEFMTAAGQFGFAPTDAEVGPDGSLYVSVGGRGTRGGVFRVRYVGQADRETEAPDDDLAACLDAPQPLSSWSRARWEPLAYGLGREPFAAAALDAGRPTPARVRAIEILTELFDGLDDDGLGRLAEDAAPEVRARAVWSLGRTQAAAPSARLVRRYLEDDDPLVVRCALEALLGAGEFERLLPALPRALGAEQRYVRQTAARVVARLPEPHRTTLQRKAAEAGPLARLWFEIGRTLPVGQVDLEAVEAGLAILESDAGPETRSDAVRLIQLALGDMGPDGQRAPVFDGYAGPLDLAPYAQALKPVRGRLTKLYPLGDRAVDDELARLLAMLAPRDAKLLDRVLARIGDDSHPVDDIHQLIVAARIPVRRTDRQRDAVASALVRLEPKIVARNLKQDLNWEARMGELYRQLVGLDPGLPAAIVDQPEFGRPGHVMFLSELREGDREAIIDAFVARIREDADYPWTADVVFVLGESERPERLALVRGQYDHFALRGAVLMVLSRQPEPQDRRKFLAGLDSPQHEVLAACLDALAALPPDRSAPEQFALVRTLRRLGSDAREHDLRERVVKLLRRNAGREFGFVFGPEGRRPQPEPVARWTAWVAETWPEQAALQPGGRQADLEQLRRQLAAAPWEQGDPERGRRLFEIRSCAQCHGGRQALGPDLAGLAKRFSREDMFVAIVFPDRDVSPRYQTTMVQTFEGRVHTGLIIYESVDGLILRNAQNQTFRIEAHQIEARRRLNSSLMPSGLLDGLSPQDWADLDAYLQSL